MARFGYSEDSAETVKTALDLNLRCVEFYLEQIAKTVPQAGATTSRLDEAKEIARDVVGELHDEVDRRTEVVA